MLEPEKVSETLDVSYWLMWLIALEDLLLLLSLEASGFIQLFGIKYSKKY
jgi:hypothetical protein